MNKIQLTRYYVQIQADSDDTAFLLFAQKHPVDKMRSANTYRCALSLLPELLKELRGIDDASQLSGVGRELYEEELQRRRMTEELKRLGPDVHHDGFWEHQDLGVCLARYNRRYNFFYDTRTGKTRMSYQIMLDALREGRARRCLVLAPSAIIPDWLSDAKHFPELKVEAYYKDDKTKRRALTNPCHVLIWSEGMLAENLEFIKAIGFDMCIFDESSKLKSYKSQVSKAAMELCLTIPYWYNLSATPAPNGEWEYYVQMFTVRPYAFSSYITHFYNRWFDNISQNPKYKKWQLKEFYRKDFTDIITDCSIYVDQSVMPMAAKTWTPYSFKMPGEIWEYYRTMASDMVVELEALGLSITADQAAAARAKMNQITSGFVLDTDAIKDNKLMRKLGEKADSQEVYMLDTGSTLPFRVAALRRLLDHIEAMDPGCSVIIWANYAAEFTMLRQFFGSQAGYIRGGTSTKSREEIIAAFRSKKIRFLVAHPLSIGMGINLTVAHHAIYYSMNDSWEALKQSSERICGHIDVQPNDCSYWVLQAEGTVNEVIYDNVSNKRDASTGFMEHLKAVALYD